VVSGKLDDLAMIGDRGRRGLKREVGLRSCFKGYCCSIRNEQTYFENGSLNSGRMKNKSLHIVKRR
jgi:hypothetical protein